MAETNTSLTEAPFVQLQKEDFVLLHTDTEDGSPTSSTISWDEKTYDLRAANRLDIQAFAAMRKAQ
ncbi:hypothetical protein [Cohnella lupini]|uniref:Uncharacterized protein n=1 Tax=Cohnella lupini TaxID=1294267 RepID=A0A3D9IXC1_9BACL|nr:hypothetical protein [Cohnella lupini]RED65756.1 hypothetical protein DFP95_101247 [Cohnella lupini]